MLTYYLTYLPPIVVDGQSPFHIRQLRIDDEEPGVYVAQVPFVRHAVVHFASYLQNNKNCLEYGVPENTESHNFWIHKLLSSKVNSIRNITWKGFQESCNIFYHVNEHFWIGHFQFCTHFFLPRTPKKQLLSESPHSLRRDRELSCSSLKSASHLSHPDALLRVLNKKKLLFPENQGANIFIVHLANGGERTPQFL